MRRRLPNSPKKSRRGIGGKRNKAQETYMSAAKLTAERERIYDVVAAIRAREKAAEDEAIASALMDADAVLVHSIGQGEIDALKRRRPT